MSDKPREVLRDHASMMRLWMMGTVGNGNKYNPAAGDDAENTMLDLLRAYERMRFEEDRADAERRGATGA